MSLHAARSALNRAFAGVDRTALVSVALVALVNTIRRSINTNFAPPFGDWLFDTAVVFVESLVLGILVLFAAVSTFKRTKDDWRRNAAGG